MKKFYFLFLLLIATVKFVGGQTLLAGWDFQTTANGGTSIVGTPSTQQLFISNVGLGTLYLDGTNGSSNWLQTTELDGFAGTNINAGGSTGLSTVITSPASLGLRNGSTNSANNKAIVFKFSMTGYKNLVVSYATSSTSTGFNSQSWAYSLNGITWTDIQTIIPSTAFTLQTLATITSLDNAGTAYLRLIVSGASGINNQSNKLDNIQFNATSICGGSQLWSGNTGTDWNTAGNWCNGTIPTISSIVNIPSGLTNYPVISTADALAASVTISNGASLNMSGPYNLTLSSGATFTNSGTFTGAANTGAVIFAGSGTVAGAVSFNNVTINGAVDFGSTGVSTVTGNLTINLGGSVALPTTHLVTYGSSSSLIYNTGTATTVGNEWTTYLSPAVAGAGLPNNVIIQNNSTVTIANSNTGGWSTDRSIAGNLIINSGSTFNSSINYDLYIAGNWTNNGIFNANGRTVTFNAISVLPKTQTIAGTTVFYNLTFGNPNITTDFGFSITTVANQFNNDAGTMIGSTSTVILTGGSGTIKGGAAKNFYNLQINIGANITHTTGGGNVHIDNTYTNNGSYTEGPNYTTYFDKNSGTTSLSGSGTTIFGNVTIGQSGTIGLGTILNANAHSFTVSGTNFTFNHTMSTFNGGSSTVTFNGATDLIGIAMSVTGTNAAFYGITVLNTTTLGVNITVNGPLSITNAANKLAINGNTLSLNGTVAGSGTLTGSSTSNVTVGTSGSVGTLNFDQATDNITNVLKDFTVKASATATFGNALNIVAGTSPGTVTANGTITTNNYLTLRSDINGTSRVAASSGSINGNVTVERYIATGPSGGVNHGKSWQLLAIPTQGQSIKASWMEGATTTNVSPTPPSPPPLSGNPNPGYGTMITSDLTNALALGFDAYTTPGPSMKTYVSNLGNYVGPSSTASAIYDQRGYFVFVRGDRSVYTFNGTATPTVLRTKGTLFTMANVPPQSSVSGNRFTSVGNPYASSIDLRKLTLGSGGPNFGQGVNSTVYVWDPSIGGAYGYGAFQALYLNSGNYVNLLSSNSYGTAGTIHNDLQSGQAFIIQDAINTSGGSITFTEADKSTGNYLLTSPYRTGSTVTQLMINLNAMNTGNPVLSDGALLQYSSNYSSALDGSDVRKFTNLAENLSINSAGELLVIERRQFPTSQDTVFLNLTGEKAQPYQFELLTTNMYGQGLQAYFEDSYLQTRTALNMNGRTTVDMTIVNTPASYAPDRFRIVFTSVNAGPLPVTFTNVKATPHDNVINIEWQVNNELNIKNYTVEKSVDGIHFNTLEVTDATGNGGRSASYLVADNNPVEGYNYYRIRSNDQDGKTILTQVVKAFIGSLKHDIVVNPNPITNGNITLQFQNMPAGKYNIRLLNKLGQVIMKKQVTRMDGNNTETLKWNFNLAHGMYQLEIIKPDSGIKNINVIY